MITIHLDQVISRTRFYINWYKVYIPEQRRILEMETLESKEFSMMSPGYADHAFRIHFLEMK